MSGYLGDDVFGVRPGIACVSETGGASYSSSRNVRGTGAPDQPPNTRVILRAKWDAIKGLPKMWRKRQAIQSIRKATVREVWRVLDKQIIPAK